jgi:hypothetical protein
MIRVICQEINGLEPITKEEPISIETIADEQTEEKVAIAPETIELWTKDFDHFNCHNLGELCQQLLDGEPVFILRAQDKLSLQKIKDYKSNASKNKASKTVLARVKQAIDEFSNWRKNNKEKVKLPD